MNVIPMPRQRHEPPRDADTELAALDRLYEYCRGIIARQARRIAELEERVVDGAAGPEFMTTAQVAKHINISQAKLAQMRARGEGPKFSKIGRAIRYRRADVDAWVAEHRVTTENR